jgi:nucleoid-associated protein YgaU
VRDAALAVARAAREAALAAARAARAAAEAAARAAAAAAEATARAARAAAEATARAAREAANAVGGAAKSVGNFFCFSRNTPIKLLDGRVILMKDIKIGDVLINGVMVQATMQIQSSQDDPFYKIYSEEIKDYIYVTGSHHIQNGDKYVLVRDFDKSEKLDTVDDELCCLVTSDHTIPIGEFTFWDWEDNLL